MIMHWIFISITYNKTVKITKFYNKTYCIILLDYAKLYSVLRNREIHVKR